jgi:hypothetical protein
MGVPQLGYTGVRALIIEPSGGGGGRRRRRRLPHHGGHRPGGGADDTLGGVDLHWSMTSTPRTAGATFYHHATNLTDTLPCRASTATDTSFKRRRPLGLWYATGSKEFVQQPASPSVRPLHCPIQQRSSARVVELNGRASPVSGQGRGGAVPRNKSEWIRFGAGGGHQEEEHQIRRRWSLRRR